MDSRGAPPRIDGPAADTSWQEIIVRMRWLLVAVGLLVLTNLGGGTAQEQPIGRDPDALLALASCSEQARAALRAWAADTSRAMAEPPGPAGTRAVRMPSATFGAWVRLAVEASGEAVVERITAVSVEARSFDASCRPTVQVREATALIDAGLTDEALAARLAQDEAGAILVWSPHMPLSVDEYAELQDAAAALKLSLVAVLDPAADAGYARRVAAARGLPESALVRLASIELAFRGMTTHAPSVQVFADGRLVGPVLFGYRNRESARAAIARVLAER